MITNCTHIARLHKRKTAVNPKTEYTSYVTQSRYQTSDKNRTILSYDIVVRFLSHVWHWKLYNFLSYDKSCPI